jgi:hypothetical protein
MRSRALSMLLLVVVPALCIAASPSRDVRTAEAARAAARFGQLSILSPESGDAPSPLRWSVWDNGFGPDQAVDLVLFRRQGETATRAWSQRWPEGYLPRIRNIWNWQYEQQPVLMLVFQYGAALEHLELFGLDKQDRVVPLARAEATMFETRTSESGLRIVAGQSAGEPPRCLQYHPAPPRLTDVPCDVQR